MLRVVEAGVSLAPGALQKRVRLVNVLSIFGLSVLLGSVPFDWVTAPPWMIGEDLSAPRRCCSFPWLNAPRSLHPFARARRARHDLIVLTTWRSSVAKSGAQMVFFALAATRSRSSTLPRSCPWSRAVAAGVAVSRSRSRARSTACVTCTSPSRPSAYYAYSS
jgi:hypothetical protein